MADDPGHYVHRSVMPRPVWIMPPSEHLEPRAGLLLEWRQWVRTGRPPRWEALVASGLRSPMGASVRAEWMVADDLRPMEVALPEEVARRLTRR